MTNESTTQSDLESTDPRTAFIVQWIEEGNVAFEAQCKSRHEKGQEEYGTTTFLGAPTIEMAMEEAADLSNYARYTYIKLYFLKKHTEYLQQEHEKSQQQADSHGFVPLSKINLGGLVVLYTTRSGIWHDFTMCAWRFYDSRGQQVAIITDEAYDRVGFTPRDIVLATS